MSAAHNTARSNKGKNKNHFSPNPVELRTMQLKKYGFEYFEFPQHPGLKYLAERVVELAAKDIEAKGVSVYSAGPLLIGPLHAMYALQSRVENGLIELGIGVDRYLHCAVDCMIEHDERLARAVPHTTVYTILR